MLIFVGVLRNMVFELRNFTANYNKHLIIVSAIQCKNFHRFSIFSFIMILGPVVSDKELNGRLIHSVIKGIAVFPKYINRKSTKIIRLIKFYSSSNYVIPSSILGKQLSRELSVSS